MPDRDEPNDHREFNQTREQQLYALLHELTMEMEEVFAYPLYPLEIPRRTKEPSLLY